MSVAYIMYWCGLYYVLVWFIICISILLFHLLVGELSDDDDVEQLCNDQSSDKDQDSANDQASDDQDSFDDQDSNTEDGQNSDDERSSSDNERSNDQDSLSEGSRVISTKWKEGLVNKTAGIKVNLQHLIYTSTSTCDPTPSDDNGSHGHTIVESEGVLLRHCRDDQRALVHQCDSSCIVRSPVEWSAEQVTALKTLCVTGSWGDNDAAMQLQSSSDEEVTMEMDDDELVAKKQKLKASFNEEYDSKQQGVEHDHFSEMKEKLAAQAELNKSTFEGMADELRWQLEGFPAGCYVRMEIKDIPCELIERFDPRQPLIVGGLSPGEEKLSYLQVGGALCAVNGAREYLALQKLL